MKSPCQSISLALLFASAVVLGSLPGTASAQDNQQDGGPHSSNEYQRGYQQGYHHGYRDGRQQANDRRRNDRAPITITEARYGAGGQGVCDAREAIQRAVGQHTSARIRVGNELCGDPAKGTQKHIEVQYRCGNHTQRVNAPEHTDIILRCQ